MKNPRWNPYLVGALIGLVCILAFALPGKAPGMSTGLSQAAGACALPFLGSEGVAANAYWSKPSHRPGWDYSTLFLVGTAAGALISAAASGALRFTAESEEWSSRFGSSRALRLTGAFLGGALLLFGARLADGCTSGHGISGTLQLAASGWVFFAVMFLTGSVTAALLYRRRA